MITITKYKNFFMMAAVVLLVAVVLQGWQHRQPAPATLQERGDTIKVVPFETVTGWGYYIYINDKAAIFQDRIPALPGKQGFASKAAALRVGHVVAEKIRRQELPTVSVDELQRLHISAAAAK